MDQRGNQQSTQTLIMGSCFALSCAFPKFPEPPLITTPRAAEQKDLPLIRRRNIICETLPLFAAKYWYCTASFGFSDQDNSAHDGLVSDSSLHNGKEALLIVRLTLPSGANAIDPVLYCRNAYCHCILHERSVAPLLFI